MGCGASVEGAGALHLRVGDAVELRPGVTTTEELRVGEVGELVELSAGGVAKVRGPRYREKWLRSADLRARPGEELGRLEQAKWHWRRRVPTLRDSPGVERGDEEVARRVARGRAEEAAPREPTHYDFLAPFLPVIALPHTAACSQSLGGAWAGDSLGAALVAQLVGITAFVEEQMLRLGEAGAERVEQFCEVMYGALIEAARTDEAAPPGCVSHIYGDRLVISFGREPSASGPNVTADGSVEPPALRLAVTVVQVADLAQADTVGRSDPFVVVEVDGRSSRTATVSSVGGAASWGERLPGADTLRPGDEDSEDHEEGEETEGQVNASQFSGETLCFEMADLAPGETVSLRCYDSAGGQDDVIGRTTVPVSSPADRREGTRAEWATEGWHDLTAPGSSHKRGAIRVRLRSSWVFDSDKAVDRALKLSEAMHECVEEWGTGASVALKVGIGAGRLQHVHTHAERLSAHARRPVTRRKAMVRGAALAEAAAAAADATPGQTLVSPATAESVREGAFHFSPVESPASSPHLLLARDSAGTREHAELRGLSSGLELPPPHQVGCSADRGKAHAGLIAYVPRVAVAFAQSQAEFRRVCVLSCQLHGFPANDLSLTRVADLNAAFQDCHAALESENGDGFISQCGYGFAPADDSAGCTAVFGLGDSEETAAHCEIHAVRAALSLSDLLRQKACGSQLPTQHMAGAAPRKAPRPAGRVGASIGVATGWAFVGGVGHRARHELCTLGDVVDISRALMADPAAAGTVLVTDAVEAKAGDDFECMGVPPYALQPGTLVALEGTARNDGAGCWRACQAKLYL